MIMTAMDFPNTLSLLSSMYLCRPTKGSLASWKTLFPNDIPDYLRDLKSAVDGMDLSSEQELEDLLWEYTRLFIGPYKLPCPPWESVYTSSKRLMMQDAYSGVQQLYNEIGLVAGSPDILADHIGMELNFMAILLHKLCEDIEGRPCYADLAKRFLDEHLTQWIPQFARDMEEAADSVFYKALARTTRGLIDVMVESDSP